MYIIKQTKFDEEYQKKQAAIKDVIGAVNEWELRNDVLPQDRLTENATTVKTGVKFEDVNKKMNEVCVGVLHWNEPEINAFCTDKYEFYQYIADELPHQLQNGFTYQISTKDNEIRNKVNEIVSNMPNIDYKNINIKQNVSESDTFITSKATVPNIEKMSITEKQEYIIFIESLSAAWIEPNEQEMQLYDKICEENTKEILSQKNVSDSDTFQTKEDKKTMYVKNTEPKNFYDLNKLLEIPIVDILHEYGIDNIKQSGNKLVCAIREESEPSMYIYPATNTFNDFGLSVGGNGINLVALLEKCNKTAAIYKLAELFNIQPLNRAGENYRKQLTNAQYEKIGLAGDKATKNFDFNLEEYNEYQTKKFAEKYNMTMNDLAEKYPKNYNNVIKLRAVPYVYELRNEYYNQCFVEDMLCKSLKIDIISDKKYWKNIEVYRDIAQEAERILSKAVTNTELKNKISYHKYDIENDIKNIRDGKLQFEIGTEKYINLKGQANKAGENILYKQYSLEDFLSKQDAELKDSVYAAFVKGDTVNIAYRPNEPTMKQLDTPNISR